MPKTFISRGLAINGRGALNVELSERAWEAFSTSLGQVNVHVRRGMYPLASTEAVGG